VTFLAPFWLAAAAAAALGVAGLHFITTQRPPPSALPTARFVPPGDARASSRMPRPTDLFLLLLRCAALLLMGAAFAGPVTVSRGARLARVVVADRSRGAEADVRDSAVALTRPGDVLVPFDFAATSVALHAADSARALVAGRSRGSLSAALVRARRAARDLSDGADSVELVIVSPLTADELDAASEDLFRRWPGRARLVRTRAAAPGRASVSLVSGDPQDELRPRVAALDGGAGRGAARATVRVLRAAPSAADSTAARDGSAVVSWPRIGGATPSAQGLWAGSATVVAPLARLPVPEGGRVVARWADGERAAAEWPVGRGCIRVVGVGVPSAGDVTLQPAFAAVARSLLAPCEWADAGGPAPDSVVRVFARPGAAATAAAVRSSDARSPFSPWLLAASLLLLAGESLVRGGRVEAPS